MKKIKTSTIPYGGYDYQTLQAVLLLTQWINNPTAYKRMLFDADGDTDELPQGIDDIICERSDGKIDYRQVKFTPDVSKKTNHLSWDWLIKKSGKTDRSRSILKKLSDAVLRVPVAKRGEIILLTNKRPDREFEQSLVGNKVSLDKIAPQTLATITEQLGSDDAVKSLFSVLEIRHSEVDYQSLERRVSDQLEPISNDDGFHRLLNRARTWAIFKDTPSEEGWIYLHQVRQVLALDRPEPIPQSFEVPEHYILPDAYFHDETLLQITQSSGSLITLTGEPGRGKSTYLSYLCEVLDVLDIPTIRHHYFLSTSDTTYDRLSSRIVAESLLSQMASVCPDIPIDTVKTEELGKYFAKCGEDLKTNDKPLVVIIDGLDHVWRDNSGDKKPLDYLFKQLLPLPPNVILIVGTQPVDDTLLPSSLLQHSPRKEWRWLPPMTGNAIYEYVQSQVTSGRLHLTCHEAHKEETLKEAADALATITSGYPLHVIYSCEYLAQHGSPLSTWEVDKLPPCTDGKIVNYYSMLWQELSNQQKDVLHLCCGFQLTWPRQALSVVLDDSPKYPPSINAVAHMLYESRAGLTPFHESLVVFVTSQDEHADRVTELTVNTCDWLNHSAPKHLKDEWYWSCLAKQGDTEPLLAGLTRDWVLDRLTEGHAIDTHTRLLTQAETIVFERLDFAKAYSHRELKIRLINGIKFQTWDAVNLEVMSNILATDLLIEQKLSTFRHYSPLKLAILSISLWYRGNLEEAKRLSESALRKHRSSSKLVNRRDNQEPKTEIEAIVKAGVLNDTLNYGALFGEGTFKDWPEEYVKAFVDGCLIKRDIGLLIQAYQCLSDKGSLANLEQAIVRLSAIEGVDILSWPEYTDTASGSLTEFVKTFTKNNFHDIDATLDSFDSDGHQVSISANYYDWFFSCLSTQLSATADFCWLPVAAVSGHAGDQLDVSRLYHALTEMASNVAIYIIEDGAITFDVMAALLHEGYLLEGDGWKEGRENILFQRDWLEMCSDCHWVTTQKPINSDAISYVIDNDVFSSVWLRLWYTSLKLNALSDDALTVLISAELNSQDNTLEETIERSNGNLELAELAFRHGHLDLFGQTLRLCWDYVIGYGHHKDTAVFNVLSAISYLTDSCPQESVRMIERISPIIYSISAFTDGDETRHSKHSLSGLIAKLSPMTMLSKYEQEVRDGEWYYANETLTCLLEKTDLSSPFVQTLYLTGLEDEQNQKVYQAGEDGEVEAKLLTSKILEMFGCESIQDHKKKDSPTTESEDIDIAVEDYPPEHLLELDAALSGKYSTRKFWRKWYVYWQDNGKEKELVEYLLPSILDSDDRLDDKRLLLDELFISHKKLRGKKRAFNVLAKAQIVNNGWSDWYESEKKTLKRLKLVSTIYSDQADTFIIETTKYADDWRSKSSDLIIPNDKLVYLLNECGRTEEALELTSAMIASLEESTRNLPLMQPDWVWGQTYQPEVLYSKILISRLKWPVPTIKLWVCYQLAKLLTNSPAQIEPLLSEELALRTQESECVELLCVFLIARESGYKVGNEIGPSIIARSTLSDMIINDLGLSEYGEYSTDFHPNVITSKHQVDFDKAQGHHFPLMYKSALEREEERTQLPFVDHYISEWCHTYDYANNYGSDISYFFGSERDSGTGEFYTNLSHRGRSAYLRTLEVAKTCYGMPNDYAEHLAALALPIDTAYLSLLPKIPDWFFDWPHGDDISPEKLKAYIQVICQNIIAVNNTLELGALSFPVKISDDEWLDITITRGLKRYESDILPNNDRSCGLSVGDKLKSEIIYHGNERILEGNTGFLPITGTTFPISRYGHWHSDMESRGLYVPLHFGIDTKVRGQSSNGVLKFHFDTDIIGELGFWYYKWSPVHPKPLKSFCGSYTLLDMTRYSKWISRDLLDFEWSYLCEVKHLQREYSYSEFSVSVSTFLV